MDLFGMLLWVRERKWIGYAIAVVTPFLGIAVRFGIAGELTGYPFVTFFPPILLAAALGGRWPGAVSSVLSALLADYFISEPHNLNLPWPIGWIGMGAFFIVAATMVLFIDYAILAGERVTKATALLRTLNTKLEERVADRTRELTMMTAQLRDEIRTKESAETQLRQMQKMQALGQLTSGIAHDFNNMLSIIIGSLDIAGRRLKQGRGEVDGLIDNALDGARRAATLTHQLLAFSRRQPLAPVVTDINGLVSNLSEMFRRTLGADIELECVLSGGLWRSSVDPGQLENAILNLVVNGRDAMQDGGRLTIETQNAFLDDAYAEAQGEVVAGQYVLIAITDTGTGMTPEVVAAAFDPFFTTKAEGQGTGLGLSQVYGFIKQSGGHTNIYSELGQGTTVKIYLPRHFAEQAVADRSSEPSPDNPAPMGSPEEIILVVDDDEAVRAIHVGMLRELNYTVRHADGGPAALNIIREHGDIALLFTDVVMPRMSGRVLAESAVALMPKLKVLYTTGYTPNAVVHNGVVDHGVDLLPKPFRYEQLARKIRIMLDRP